MSLDFTEDEIAELEASMHESMMQLDASPTLNHATLTANEESFMDAAPILQRPPSQEAAWEFASNYSDQLFGHQGDVCFEDEMYAYDFFIPQYSHSIHTDPFQCPTSGNGSSHSDGFYFYYDGPQEDPYAAEHYGTPPHPIWTPTSHNSPSSLNFHQPTLNPRHWDKEAYYYDLQGNLVYKPPEEPDLLEQLTQLNIALEASDKKDQNIKIFPSYENPFLDNREDSISTSGPIKSPRREKCRYNQHCHAGVNCPYSHSPL